MYKDEKVIVEKLMEAYREAVQKSHIEVGSPGFLDTDRNKGFAQGIAYAAYLIFHKDIVYEEAILEREKDK